jgi:hypothetical protein
MTNLAIVVVKVASSRNYLDCSCIEPQENVGNCGQSWAAKLLKLQKTPVFMRSRSDYESAALPLSYLGPSVNPLPLAQQPQADEPNIPLHLRLNGLSREAYFPANAGFVPDGEFAKADCPQCLGSLGRHIETKKTI